MNNHWSYYQIYTETLPSKTMLESPKFQATAVRV